MFPKEKVKLIFAEFIGTALLATAVLVVSNMFSLGTSAWYISITAGVTLALIVTMIGSVSGAHVNPAVTIGLWTLKKIQTSNAIVYISAQLLGGACALIFYSYVSGVVLSANESSSFEWNVFWAELVGAVVFGMGIAAAVSQKLEGGFKAITIGMSLTLGALFASIASAGYLNPAVALANNAWDLTLVVAPVVGMVIGMNVYMSLLAPTETKKKK